MLKRFFLLLVLIIVAVLAIAARPGSQAHGKMLETSQNQTLARVTVDFHILYNPDSSNECEAEAYLELFVNRKKDIWGKERTDRDRSTIPDCNRWVRIDRSLTVDLSERDNLDIVVIMHEKDGRYHPAAYTQHRFSPGEWTAWQQKKVTDRSTRANNPYGDQDFSISYTIKVNWPNGRPGQPSALPDLEISPNNVSVEKSQGYHWLVTNVTNNGQGVARGFNGHCTIHCPSLGERIGVAIVQQGYLVGRHQATYSSPFVYWCTGKPRIVRMDCQIDSDNSVQESNERNNSFSVNVTMP